MKGQVLWQLDEETDWRTFERLAADLLYRNGYPRIVPVEGPRDGGRDAQSQAHPGRGRHGELTFFQFSTEGEWKKKLRRELRKVRAGAHDPKSFVFVTTQRVRGEEHDAMVFEADEKFGFDLTIFSREWLRLQLEVANPDLALHHLGVPPEPHREVGAPEFARPDGSEVDEAWSAFQARDFATAIPGLRRYLDFSPDDYWAREALAWSQYQEHHCADALVSINRALEFRPEQTQGLMIRACILAEYGIAQGNRASISEANAAFEEAAEQKEGWVVRYNFGNTLSALGRHEEALAQYERAIELDSDVPKVWKNLASCLHHLGKHDDEMNAFDRALELNPELTQGLISKGVSLLVDFGEAKRAITYLRKAMGTPDGQAARWPHTWYWLAMAQDRAGDPRGALDTITEGLRYQPGSHYLQHLRIRLLCDRWRSAPRLKDAARQLLPGWLREAPNEYFVAAALSEIREADGDHAGAWQPLVDSLDFFGLDGTDLPHSGFLLAEVRAALNHLPDYAAYRQAFPVSTFLTPERHQEAPWAEFAARLEARLAVPFGTALASAGKDETSIAPEALLSMLRIGIEQASISAASVLADLITPDAEKTEVAQSLSETIGTPSVAALFEFTSMSTWLATKLQLDQEAFHQALERFPLGALQGAVAVGSYKVVNDIVGLFRDEESGDSGEVLSAAP